MSIEGYFDSVIDIWYRYPKHTKCMTEDMKTVIRQFNQSIAYEDISEGRIKDLTDKFNKIYKEVYK